MTEREAFDAARYSNEWELWQVACKWQREQCANLCADEAIKQWANYEKSPVDYIVGQADCADYLEQKLRVRQPVAVLAGNRAQFLEWQRQNPEVRGVFCDQWPMFAGLEFSSMVEVGTFGLRPDALEMWQHVAPRVRPNALGKGRAESASSD